MREIRVAFGLVAASMILPAALLWFVTRSGVPDEGHGVSPAGDVDAPEIVLEDRWQKAAEERLWYGNEIARRWARVTPLPADVRMEEHDEDRLRRVREVLANVSPALRRRLVAHSGKIVFHEGRVTDLDECRDLRGRRCGLRSVGDSTYDDVVGLYRPRLRTAFVQTDRSLPRVRHTLLHELGHMLDDLLDDRSQSPAFDDVLTHDDARADLGYPERVEFRHRRRSEYFAESFADYHTSGASRLWMRSARPAAARFWDDLVERENLRRHRELEVEVNVSLRRRRAGEETDAASIAGRRRERRRVTVARR